VISLDSGSLDLPLFFFPYKVLKIRKNLLKRMVNSTHWEENLKQASTVVGRKVYKLKVKVSFSNLVYCKFVISTLINNVGVQDYQ